jgi:hypothetical protein
MMLICRRCNSKCFLVSEPSLRVGGCVLVSRGRVLNLAGPGRGRPAGAALRGRGFARRFLLIRRWCRFAAQDPGNHRLGFCQQQLALLVAVLIAPFETGLIRFAWPKTLRGLEGLDPKPLKSLSLVTTFLWAKGRLPSSASIKDPCRPDERVVVRPAHDGGVAVGGQRDGLALEAGSGVLTAPVPTAHGGGPRNSRAAERSRQARSVHGGDGLDGNGGEVDFGGCLTTISFSAAGSR